MTLFLRKTSIFSRPETLRTAAVVIGLLGVMGMAAVLRAQPATTPSALSLYDRVTPSLVVVQYTFDGELGRRELNFGGVVVTDDGMVISSILTTPVQLPNEQLTEFKLIIPGDEETELDADFLGRDERTSLAVFRCKQKRAWTPLKFEEVTVKVGDPIYSVGLLPKEAGYKSALSVAAVAALLRGPVPQVLVSGGLGPVDSPVFNAEGKAIGMVLSAERGAQFLNDPRANAVNADPTRAYVPSRDFLLTISDPPTLNHPMKLPQIGVASLTGLKKDVAEYFGLKNQPAVQVGDVFPGFPADKAGIKSGDVIVQLNGQPLERGDEPEETPLIMTRKIQRLRVGETIRLGVIRARGEPPLDIAVTLGERPVQANQVKRFYAEDLGFTSRDLVLEDRYVRKMPLEARGVVVALVRPDSAAQSGKLANGDVIKKLNQNDVTDVDSFKTDYQAFRKERPAEPVVMEVQRGPNTQIVRIEPPQ